MEKHTCSSCKHELRVRLMPDFCSSGIWCENCGVNLSPNEIGLPNDLIERLDAWVLAWDNEVGDGYVAEAGWNARSIPLALELKKYVYCSLVIMEEKPHKIVLR